MQSQELLPRACTSSFAPRPTDGEEKQIRIPGPHVAHGKPGLGELLEAEPVYDQQGKGPGSTQLQAHPQNKRTSPRLLPQAEGSQIQLKGHSDSQKLLPQRHHVLVT